MMPPVDNNTTRYNTTTNYTSRSEPIHMAQNESNQTQALSLRQEIDKYMECAAKEEAIIASRNSVEHDNLSESGNMDTLISTAEYKGQKLEVQLSPGIDGQNGYAFVVTSSEDYNEELSNDCKNASYEVIVGSSDTEKKDSDIFEQTESYTDAMDFGYITLTKTVSTTSKKTETENYETDGYEVVSESKESRDQERINPTKMHDSEIDEKKTRKEKQKKKGKKSKKGKKKTLAESGDDVVSRKQKASSLKRSSSIYAYEKQRQLQRGKVNQQETSLNSSKETTAKGAKSSNGNSLFHPLLLVETIHIIDKQLDSFSMVRFSLSGNGNQERTTFILDHH